MTTNNSEVTGTIEDWAFDNTRNIVWGNLYNDVHGRWRDGTYIHTSNITSNIEDIKEGAIIKTLNSTYLLGKEQTANDNKD